MARRAVVALTEDQKAEAAARIAAVQPKGFKSERAANEKPGYLGLTITGPGGYYKEWSWELWRRPLTDEMLDGFKQAANAHTAMLTAQKNAGAV